MRQVNNYFVLWYANALVQEKHNDSYGGANCYPHYFESTLRMNTWNAQVHMMRFLLYCLLLLLTVGMSSGDDSAELLAGEFVPANGADPPGGLLVSSKEEDDDDDDEGLEVNSSEEDLVDGPTGKLKGTGVPRPGELVGNGEPLVCGDTSEENSPNGCVREEGLCVFLTNKKTKWYCSLCSVDMTSNHIQKIFPKNDKCKDKPSNGCKYPNPDVVPVTPTQVDTNTHVCGKKSGAFQWYCSYCSVEKNNANFRPRKACRRNNAKTDTLCIGQPQEDIPSTSPPDLPTTEAPTTSPRTVFPPLQPLCIPDSQGTYSNCPCPTDYKVPKMNFALPDIVTRSGKPSPIPDRENPQ
ncbi:uncharacterized protein LOC119726549 [Patiria miniata]|uniref:Uncharacterized protein n=1 Tax=Patiria miniata TaxID=46514 RepID=A0A913ZS37_PATMI|nr:uncharacterized protein LOC119726549 [Patiria miniata]